MLKTSQPTTIFEKTSERRKIMMDAGAGEEKCLGTNERGSK